jgi:predicted PurR-regulated permease PerM
MASRPFIVGGALVNYRAIERVAFRTVLLVAALVLAALAFRQLVTLAIAVLATVLIAVVLDAGAVRLERRRIPRKLGALLTLIFGLALLALILYLVVPPFVDQTNRFVNNVPHIANDIQNRVHSITGASKSEIGHRVQKFVRGYTDNPEKLIGPITSIGLNVFEIVIGVLIILVVAYYMAANPEPLTRGLLRLFPPDRRDHAAHVLGRLRTAWVGWMQGVAVNMIVTTLLVWFGLWLIGLDYAFVFGVLSGLFVVIPYYGAFLAGIPPVLFGLADSPGKALLTLVVYIAAHEVEGNITVPLVMSRTVQLHPAVIAIGVLVVGRLLGFAGLFVAVPVLSFVTITIEEFWVKPMEDADRRRAREDIELPSSAAEEQAREPPPSEPFALEEVIEK